MSGLGSINAVQVPQVNLANYNGLGNIVAQAGNVESPLAAAAKGLQAGMGMANQRAELDMKKQQLMEHQKASALQQFQQTKSRVADQAFQISQLPEDKREEAYNIASAEMVKAGLVKIDEVPAWGEGGADMVSQLATQSPMAMEAAKNTVQMEKAKADIELTKARISAVKGTSSGGTGTAAGQKPLSSDAAKVYEIAQSGASQVDELRAAYGSAGPAPNLMGAILPNALQPADVQNISRLKNDLSDRIGRLRSGGAINADEVAKFNKLLPVVGDSDLVVNKKLDQLSQSFSAVTNSIRPQGTTGTMEMSREDQFAEYRKMYPNATDAQIEAGLKK